MNVPNWKRKLTDLLELPADVTLDLPRLLIIGQVHLTVENHRGLVEYSDERVIIGVPTGRLVVRGEDLAISLINADEVTLVGRIRSVDFAGMGTPDSPSRHAGAAGDSPCPAGPLPPSPVEKQGGTSA